MKAMILAAGKGTRLHPISVKTPKPLVPLVGTRLLDLLLPKLVKQGITEVAINTSHLGDEISNIYQSGSQFGLEILYSYEGFVDDKKLLPEALGSAGGLRNIQEKWDYFDDTFVVICGDAYFDIDLNKAQKFHHEKCALATVVTKEMPDSDLHKYGVVNADEDGRVVSFQEKPNLEEARSNTINTGIYIFDKRIFDLIPQGEYDIGSQLLPKLVQLGHAFYAHNTEASWLDIGNIKDIHRATRRVLAQETQFDIKGDRFGQGLWISPSANIFPHKVITQGDCFIDSGATIEANAILHGPTVIGRNCIVREGARLNRCIVMGEYLEFTNEVDLSDKIITDEHVIDLDGSYMTLDEAGVLDSRRLCPDSQLDCGQYGRYSNKIERLAGQS